MSNYRREMKVDKPQNFKSGGRVTRSFKYQDGGEVDPFEANAERIRRRYPVREPDPASLAASQGRVGWGDYAQSKIEHAAGIPKAVTQEATSLFYGGSYDPSPALESAGWAMGATPFGAPRGAFGAGPVRPSLRPTEQWWDTPAYHGSRSAKIEGSLKVSRGDDHPIPGISVTSNPKIAEFYANEPQTLAEMQTGVTHKGTVHPVQLRGSAENYPHLFEFADRYEAQHGPDSFQNASERQMHAFARKNKIYGVRTEENDEIRIFSPENVRIIKPPRKP